MRGSPASARVTSGMSIAVRPCSRPMNSATTSSISSSTVDATAVADSAIVSTPAISARRSTPRPGRGARSLAPHASAALHARSLGGLGNARGRCARSPPARAGSAPASRSRPTRRGRGGRRRRGRTRPPGRRPSGTPPRRRRRRGRRSSTRRRSAATRLRRARPRTGSCGDTRAGGQMNERATWTSGIARIWASSSPGSCSGR